MPVLRGTGARDRARNAARARALSEGRARNHALRNVSRGDRINRDSVQRRLRRAAE